MNAHFKARHCENHQHFHRSGLTFSFSLMLVGLLFLGVNTGMLPLLYKPLFSSWPIWMVAAGVFFLLNRACFISTALIAIGTFYVIPQIGAINPGLNIPANFTQIYWPVLLIVAGLYFAISRFFKPRCFKHRDGARRFFESEACTGKWNSEDGFIRVSSSFDSRKNIVLDPIFKGGEIECSFGEVVLDLRKTNLAEGRTLLKMDVHFGTVILIVPESWHVQLLGDSMFGTFSDNRLSKSFNPEDQRILIVDGKCSFGECKLRD